MFFDGLRDKAVSGKSFVFLDVPCFALMVGPPVRTRLGCQRPGGISRRKPFSKHYSKSTSADPPGYFYFCEVQNIRLTLKPRRSALNCRKVPKRLFPKEPKRTKKSFFNLRALLYLDRTAKNVR